MNAAFPPRPFLYPILDLDALGARTPVECVAALAAGGARIVQLRGKRATDRELSAAARDVLAAARAAGLLVIVNDRPDVARITSADGVHVGQDDMSPRDVRRLLPDGIVGVSTHTIEQLQGALTQPVDYVAVGPVFATATKERPDPVVGLDLVRRARALTPLPLVAIGGISLENAAEVISAGADAVAVISALFAPADLADAVRSFRVRIEAAPL
jgi:thiamine-phosphate pyrophosphorylase